MDDVGLELHDLHLLVLEHRLQFAVQHCVVHLDFAVMLQDSAARRGSVSLRTITLLHA